MAEKSITMLSLATVSHELATAVDVEGLRIKPCCNRSRGSNCRGASSTYHADPNAFWYCLALCMV